jgi:hypothetical protein
MQLPSSQNSPKDRANYQILDLTQSGIPANLREMRAHPPRLGSILNFAGLPCAEINLDEEARKCSEGWPKGFWAVRNPFLEPSHCQALLDCFHHSRQVAWSYGGYLEDRSFLLNRSYLQATESFIHAGIDFNVPAGVGIVATTPLRVLRVDSDHPEPLGWGGRLIAVPESHQDAPVVLIYAHLQGVICGPNDLIPPGSIFAETGDPQVNGGWFPHLHLQAVRRDYFDRLQADELKELDRYFPASRLDEMAKHFPDPLQFLF